MIDSTWIIQRLSKPKHKEGTMLNPFGNVILEFESPKAQEAMSQVIDPDYMGAAEYEWGAFPKCVAKMWNNLGSIKTFMIQDTNEDWQEIYLVHLKSDDDERIRELIISLYDKSEAYFLEHGKYQEVSKNDMSSFFRHINGDKLFEATCGWLNLKMRHAYFTDKTMAVEFHGLMAPAKGAESKEAQLESYCEELVDPTKIVSENTRHGL